MRELKIQLKAIMKESDSLDDVRHALGELFDIVATDENAMYDNSRYDFDYLASHARVRTILRSLLHLAIYAFDYIPCETAPKGYLIMLHVYSMGKEAYFAIYE